MQVEKLDDGTGYVLVPDKQTDEAFLEEAFTKIRELWTRKGHDYTQGSPDRLRNFRENGSRLGLVMRVVWGVYAGKHWDAITTWVKTGKVESEGIESRFWDAIVYCLLGILIYREESGS